MTPLTALAPQMRRAGTANHFDAVDVVEHQILARPRRRRRKCGCRRCGHPPGPAACSQYRPLKPRTDTAHLFALTCATWTPGTNRSRSGIVVMPDRRMSSWVMTNTAPATSVDTLLLARRGRDLDIHQIFDRRRRADPGRESGQSWPRPTMSVAASTRAREGRPAGLRASPASHGPCLQCSSTRALRGMSVGVTIAPTPANSA